MFNLTPAEKSRALLYKISKGNPQAIIAALDEVRQLANEALKSTLGHAETKALESLKERLDAIQAAYKREWQSHFNSMERTVREMVAKIEPRKGEKGDKGDKPSEAELLMLIEPLIPFVKDGEDGKVPDNDALQALIKPLIDAAVANMQPSIDQKADAEKGADDKLAGMIANEVAKKITEVKRFSGGGSGDRVKAGTGVTISTNVIGQKVISASSSGVVVETPTGSVNGSNASFTVTAEPEWIVADGIIYFAGAGYTYSALTVTMDVAPSQFIRAII